MRAGLTTLAIILLSARSDRNGGGCGIDNDNLPGFRLNLNLIFIISVYPCPLIEDLEHCRYGFCFEPPVQLAAAFREGTRLYF